MNERVAIFGATSAIAQAIARELAPGHARFFLAARSPEHLDSVAADLRVRGAENVTCCVADFADRNDTHRACVEARRALDTIDLVLVMHGANVDQEACARDSDALARALAVNLDSHVAILLAMADVLEAQGRGTLVAMGSAAGDRGKERNYLYGATKAGIAVVQQGLMARLARRGAHALLVKPAFVDTPMTADLPKGALWISPAQAAKAILAAVRARRTTVYVPWYWRYLMFVLRSLPDALFIRLKL